MLLALDAIRFHRFGLAGREPLLLMLAASLLTFALTRLYTRLARRRNWGSGRVGEVHVHHIVLGNVLMLTSGMFVIAFQPRDIGLDVFAIAFGMGAAFVLDEWALTVHLRDVYWTPEGRHSIEMSIIWALLGLLSIFLPPVGLIAAVRLARPGSIWAQRFYGAEKLERARTRFDPGTSRLEELRHALADLLGGRHDLQH